MIHSSAPVSCLLTFVLRNQLLAIVKPSSDLDLKSLLRPISFILKPNRARVLNPRKAFSSYYVRDLIPFDHQNWLKQDLWVDL